jgi:ribonuclease Z
LDCGEGTLAQLRSLYGADAPAVLHSVRCVWISHPHVDHFGGLLTLVCERLSASACTRGADASSTVAVSRTATTAPCRSSFAVVAPRSVCDWLAAGLRCAGVALRCAVLDIAHSAAVAAWLHDQHACGALTGVVALQSVPVLHCRDSFAAVVYLANKFKLVYSGDTRPCEQLIHHGRDADLLVHEV